MKCLGLKQIGLGPRALAFRAIVEVTGFGVEDC